MSKLLLPLLLFVSQAAFTANLPPKISGTPQPVAYVGEKYSFTPIAYDPEGKPLKFVIKNRPAWATFSYQSGKIAGTPTKIGLHTGIIIYAQDGTNRSVPMKTFSIQVLDNRAPMIQGAPVTQISSGKPYEFVPTASDPDSDPLTFSIANKPSWANFEPMTGRLYGTPANTWVGTYSNIQITVTDGKASASLPMFALVVTQAAVASATLSWTPPTQNTDGTSLVDLAGYRLLYGPSATNLVQLIDVPNPSLRAYIVENLTPGTWFFCVKAFNAKGQESVCSNIANKTI